MKRWADKKRTPREFQVGDRVLVKMHNHIRVSGTGLHKALTRRYEGPYPVLKKVGKVAYKIGLPEGSMYHPVFHVSLLKPFHEDEEDKSRGVSTRAPIGMKVQFSKNIDSIISN